MINRRGFLTGTTAAAVSAATSGVIASAATRDQLAQEFSVRAQTAVLKKAESFHGKHQNGIELELQTFTTFVAFDLKPDTDVSAMYRWMKLITDDAARIAEGFAPIADPHEELSLGPARSTVTIGFGPSLFSKLNLETELPKTFAKIPEFKIDKLRPEFSDGDVLIQVSADDPIVLSHAVRALTRDSMSFAEVRWAQSGFTNAQGVTREGTRQRNLMGQVDGTDNPALGSDDFDNLVWIKDGPNWIQGGCIMVLRRIAMNLDTWDALGRSDKEQVIGRKLSNGAPLTGENETDIPDFEAKNENGLSVIPAFAHIRRASPETMSERFFRRPFNYDCGVAKDGNPDVGLLWPAYMADMNQYLSVQKRLAEFDLLNKWTTPIGSSVWAIAKGVQPGEVIAAELFSSEP